MTMGDEARRRMDEVRFRDTGGNMEEIPGFNFEYNDNFQEPPPEVLPVGFWPRGRPPPAPPTICQHVQARHQAHISKTKPNDMVLQNAAARTDKRALRAKDGAVLRMPYKVVLKPESQAARKAERPPSRPLPHPFDYPFH